MSAEQRFALNGVRYLVVAKRRPEGVGVIVNLYQEKDLRSEDVPFSFEGASGSYLRDCHVPLTYARCDEDEAALVAGGHYSAWLQNGILSPENEDGSGRNICQGDQCDHGGS